jgi:hypothetical protein
MKIRDRYGYAVTRFARSPVINFLRYLIHGNISQTWKLRNRKQADPADRESYGDVQMKADTEHEELPGFPAGPYQYITSGKYATLQFTGPMTLVHDPKHLLLPAQRDLDCVAGDIVNLIRDENRWLCTQYQHRIPQGITGIMQGFAPNVQQISKGRPDNAQEYVEPHKFAVAYTGDMVLKHSAHLRLPDGKDLEIRNGDRAIFQRLDNGAALLVEFQPYTEPIQFGDVKTFLEINKGVLQ